MDLFGRERRHLPSVHTVARTLPFGVLSVVLVSTDKDAT
jgi:hypothetical protein